MRLLNKSNFLTLFIGIGLTTSCGKNNDFLYVLPQYDAPVQYSQNVKIAFSASSQVDILWVIDNSGSMSTHQQRVIDNTEIFMKEFSNRQVDWKMGLLSTDEYNDPFIGFDKPFDRSNLDPVMTFQSAVSNLGVNGSGTEKTFEPILNALKKYPEFLRGGTPLVTPLAVIIITDAKEQSEISAAKFIVDFKAIIGKKRPFFVYPVLAASDLSPTGKCEPDAIEYNYKNSPYEDFALQAKDSKAFSLCAPDFGKNLSTIAQKIVNLISKPEIRLKSWPLPETISISLNGVPLQGGRQEDGALWYYDPNRNVIRFYRLDFIKSEDDVIDFNYIEDNGVHVPHPSS